MRQVVLDTETTGLSPKYGHRIIEIGCIELINRNITQQNFHCYINPERAVDAGAVRVHGLTSEFLADKPLFADIAQELFDFIAGAELIIHNAPFDMGFLNVEMGQVNPAWRELTDHCQVLDTLPLARHKHPGQRNTLDALCRRYEVDNSERDLHGALLDAQLLARVYLAMTGGQTQLFAEPQSANAKTVNQSINRLDQARNPLPIVTANADELADHKAFLEKLRQDADKCVWDEE